MKRLFFGRLVVLPALVGSARADDAPSRSSCRSSCSRAATWRCMVKVNGKGPYRLIFDTGAPMTLLNNKIAKEADLLKGVPEAALRPVRLDGRGQGEELEVGGLKAENVPAMVMDHPTVEAISKALGPHRRHRRLPVLRPLQDDARLPGQDDDLHAQRLQAAGRDEGDECSRLMAGDRSRRCSPRRRSGASSAKKDGDEEPASTSRKCWPDSPAAAAGLKAGDRLLTLDGRWTDSLADLYPAAGYVKAGTTAPSWSSAAARRWS